MDYPVERGDATLSRARHLLGRSQGLGRAEWPMSSCQASGVKKWFAVGPAPGGPKLVLSPLGIFDFAPERANVARCYPQVGRPLVAHRYRWAGGASRFRGVDRKLAVERWTDAFDPERPSGLTPLSLRPCFAGHGWG